MRCSGFPEDEYALYALGNSGDADTCLIEEHLNAGCETCTAEGPRSRALWSAVAAATPVTKPPRAVRARLLESVSSPEQSKPKWWQSWLPVAACAGAAFVSVVVIAAIA